MRRAVGADDNGSKASRGATLVEFALVFPLFVLLFFAILEFGYYFFVQQTLQWATREGARLAMVGGALTENGNQLTRLQSVVQTIDNCAGVAVNPDSITISIFPIVMPEGSNPSGWQGEQEPGNPGDYMRVVTQYTYTFITPLIADLFPSGSNLIQAEATYQNEQF